jgi:RNA polymerase sigma-70 factor, ECF subfamily
VESDRDLVETVLQGNRAAYGALVRRYERAVYAAALSILHDRHAAQDAAQDAFVLGYQELGGLRDGAAFGKWILTIARRQAIDLHARQRIRQASLADAHDLPDIRASRDGQIDPDLQALLNAMARLPQREQRLLALRYFEEQPLEAIAQITSRSVGTVSKQIWRALQRLRRRME